jgi:hypothetical protein
MTKYDFSKVDRKLLEKVTAITVGEDADLEYDLILQQVRKQAEVKTKAELAVAIVKFLDGQLSFRVLTQDWPTHINFDAWQGRVIRELLQDWREASE